MKRLFIALALVLMLSTMAMAETVVFTWDENPAAENVDKYQVEIQDATNTIVANPEITVGEFALVSLVAGDYTAKVRAHNIWAWSGYTAPVPFKKKGPSVPTNARIEVRP
jgi:predicted phage tail protein